MANTNLRLHQSNGQAHKSAPEPPSPSPRLLTITEVSKLLNRSPRSIQEDIKKGRFGPAVIRFGPGKNAYLRFLEPEIHAWILAHCLPKSSWKWPADGRANQGLKRNRLESSDIARLRTAGLFF
jgi:hypothetical protein